MKQKIKNYLLDEVEKRDLISKKHTNKCMN